VSQLDWLARWDTLHRPGYEWTKFKAQLFDERLLRANKFYVLLYPNDPKRSCVVFTNWVAKSEHACYDKKLIKRAIRFGFPVQIEMDVIEPRPIEIHQHH
jgi:hypothetical protein